jgi:hypothetical protein
LLVDDIKIVADREFAFLFDDAKIIMEKGTFGNSFNILSKRFSNRGC